MARCLGIQGRSTRQHLTGELDPQPAARLSSGDGATSEATRGDILRESGGAVGFGGQWSPPIDLRREVVELSAPAGGKHLRPVCVGGGG